LKTFKNLKDYGGYGFIGNTGRAWNKLDLPMDSRDKDLFAASTVVMIGDRKWAQFWTSS